LPCFVEDNKITFPDCRESFANLEAQQSRASPPETSAYRRFAEKGQEVVIMVFAQLDSSFWLLAASGGFIVKSSTKLPESIKQNTEQFIVLPADTGLLPCAKNMPL
jgi:hypothetical protein